MTKSISVQTVSEKRCARCGASKARSEFYTDRRNRDGLRGSCKDCQLEWNKAWNRRNPGQLRMACRKYHGSHREERNAEARARYYVAQANPDNAEQHRQRSRQWYLDNRDYAIGVLRKLPPLDAESCAYAAVLRSDVCSYCGDRVEEIDHIVPVAKGGEHHWLNLTAACFLCNRRKYAHSLLVALAA